MKIISSQPSMKQFKLTADGLGFVPTEEDETRVVAKYRVFHVETKFHYRFTGYFISWMKNINCKQMNEICVWKIKYVFLASYRVFYIRTNFSETYMVFHTYMYIFIEDKGYTIFPKFTEIL